MKFLFKKIKQYKKLYSTYGFFSSLIILVNNLTYKILKKRYFYTPIEFHKVYLNNQIIELSKSKVMSGHYKDTHFVNESHWSKFDHASKLLGVYEEQIQELIIKTQKQYNLKNFINIGCGEGYHALGLVKNRYFEHSICYEISSMARNILKKNLLENNIKDRFVIRGEANRQEIFNDLQKIKIEETIFLIDIEGNEFNLFNDNDWEFLKKGYFIIEDHHFMVSDEIAKKNFYSSLNKHFNFTVIQNGSRNPFNINNDFLNELPDDSRFLILSECRSKKMSWIFLSPR